MARFRFSTFIFIAILIGFAPLSYAQQEYVLGAGDILRISVFQNPDLSTDARVSEVGAISFPLLGSVPLGGLTIPAAEKKIAQMLTEGGFVLKPQVNVLLSQAKGSQVAVLGQVNRPGRYPIETAGMRLSDMLSTAGGISQAGSDVVIITGVRDGKPFRREVDISAMFRDSKTGDDIVLAGGDTLYVNRASTFYIYGEVKTPGVFRLERNMTVMQALAAGGGVTPRGTIRGLVVNRRDAGGQVRELRPKMDDQIQPDDVVYLKESLF